MKKDLPRGMPSLAEEGTGEELGYEGGTAYGAEADRRGDST